MSNIAKYFADNRYVGIYQIGDRVFGYYRTIPFVGSVGNDSVISEVEGPRISIHLDLPMVIENVIRNVIIVKHADIVQRLGKVGNLS